jgi:hypothetical protein
MLDNDINIEHACERAAPAPPAMSSSEGFNSLNEAEEEEEDLLDKAWGPAPVAPVLPGHSGARECDGGDPQILHQPRQGKSLTPEALCASLSLRASGGGRHPVRGGASSVLLWSRLVLENWAM